VALTGHIQHVRDIRRVVAVRPSNLTRKRRRPRCLPDRGKDSAASSIAARQKVLIHAAAGGVGLGGAARWRAGAGFCDGRERREARVSSRSASHVMTRSVEFADQIRPAGEA
jgi:NADPH:quinone reductase-like Zn-dependent oxidoreductase